MSTTVKTIGKERLREKLSDPHVQIVNVLPHSADHLGMIKNSVKIPLSILPEEYQRLDKSKEVVTYCSGYTCNASKEAAKILSDAGYNVSAYEGGLSEWKVAHFPMEPVSAGHKKRRLSESGAVVSPVVDNKRNLKETSQTS